MSKTKVDLNPYIVNVQGKDFITFPGLLAEVHAIGVKSIIAELVNTDLTNPVVKSTVTLKSDQVFTGYGDANVNNVAKKVAGALLRMAETRATARALRFACNIDMTAIEELDTNSDDASKTHTKTAPKAQAPSNDLFSSTPVVIPKATVVAPPVSTTVTKPAIIVPPVTVKPVVQAAKPALILSNMNKTTEVVKPSFATTVTQKIEPNF